MRTKTELYQILTGIFIGCLLISNIMAAKTFEIAGVVLPTAVIIFPLVYIVNDVLAEIYGYVKTKRIIYLGFIMNVVAVACYNIAIILPSPVFNLEFSSAFETVLSNTPRILAASFAAYLVGSLVNAKVMVKMKEKLHDKLMLRCVGSTLVGEGIDAIIFITIAFSGTMPLNALLTMILAQAAFKTVFEFVLYPVTKTVINKINTLKEV